jgi:8-oxo-dGTP pyrophosphatase MutT (NUDIX family)
VADDGDIPLDAPFSAGGVIGTVHPACRCVPAPAGIEAEPPLADLGKADGGPSSLPEDDSRLVWLLLRARDEDGKWRFLLQQRDDGQWGMPGGKPHVGEDAWAAALRETTEEIGAFPPPRITGTFHHVEDDGETQVFLWLCDVPYFRPAMDGSTPEETRGAAWFRRKEIAGLDLAPKFREDWEKGICLREHVTKALQRVVNETGEILTLTGASQPLEATGARWPYPRRSDGTEWPDAGPGAVPGELGSAGAEPPNHVNDMAAPEPHGLVEPRGGDDGKMPSRGRKPNPPAAEFPGEGDRDQDMWPYPQNTLQPPMTSVGAPKADKPVTGSVPAEAPHGYRPHSYEPQAFDPGLCAVCATPQGNVIHSIPKAAQHVTDANPVEWRHVYAQLEGNFPDSALEWVKHSTWIGPVNVPWSRVDDDDIDKWAASHQPEAVSRFAKEIAKGGKHTNPSILFHQANHSDGREIIADGHHRAMARHFKLGKPVLAYVGTVPARWMKQALETHSSQLHSGQDSQNKSAQTPVVSTVHHPLGTHGLWHTPSKKVPEMQELPAYHQNTARALMRDQGMAESEAIATAVNAIKEWAQGTAFGGKVKVTPEVQAAAQRADAEWEHLKETHH